MTAAEVRPAPLVAGHPERVQAATSATKQKPLLVGAALVGLLLTVSLTRALLRR